MHNIYFSHVEIAKAWKQAKCSLIEGQLNQFLVHPSVKYCAVIKRVATVLEVGGFSRFIRSKKKTQNNVNVCIESFIFIYITYL